MKNFLSNNWRWLAPVGAVGTAVVLYLAFAIFGVHTLFIDDVVDEAGPVFDSGVGASEVPPDEINQESAEVQDDAMEDEGTAETDGADQDMADTAEVVAEFEGSFIGRAHPAEGLAQILGDGTGQRFLRFEDFATDNGPDLNVYLSTAAPDAPEGEFDDDFIDLGRLKGNIGPQNYEIPEDVDLSRYQSVVIWCVRFSVAFGAADLTPA